MGKRKLKAADLEFLRPQIKAAAQDGYASYRYGSAAPVTLPRIYRGEARKNMVERVKTSLRGWKLSPFENEGSTRAGARIALILKGHGWQSSDTEVAELIAEALHLMGAVRPSWEQGQREYSMGQDYCRYCRGLLDDEEIARHRKFCSTECAGLFLRTRDDDAGIKADQVRFHAYYLARTNRFPPKPCAWCGEVWQPVAADSETCSLDCREKLHTSRLPKLRCEQCDEPFQPHKHHGRFCSRDCTIKARTALIAAKRAAERGERVCKHCQATFPPKRVDQFYCTPRCASRASAKASKERKKATPQPEKIAFVCEEVREAA